MKHLVALFLLVILPLVLPLSSSFAATAEEIQNDILPEITLPIPENEAYRHYLGLKDAPGESFTINDIDADVILIELFSMYCPFCQEEAPNVNALYEAMADFSTADFSMKIIGIGANNSEFEVDHFRNTYQVEFPLFPDQDMSIYNILEGKGTPGFIACKRDKANVTCSVILRQSGGFYQVEEFLNDLLRKSGFNE